MASSYRCEHGKQQLVHENKKMNNEKANRKFENNFSLKLYGCCLWVYHFVRSYFLHFKMQNLIFLFSIFAIRDLLDLALYFTFYCKSLVFSPQHIHFCFLMLKDL